MKPQFKTKLKQVYGLGAGKNGSHHWIMQRLSAIFLLPLAIWYVVQLLEVLNTGSTAITNILSSPFKTTMLVGFFSVAAYHGAVGFKVIIEDYVSCVFARSALIIALYGVTLISWLAAIISLIFKSQAI